MMEPTRRPTEWVSAVAGLSLAAFAYFQDREVAAVAAAALAFVPAIVTAIATRFPALARFRPAEVAAAVAGLVAAGILFADNRDLGALFATIQAVIPAIVTGAVVATTPTAPVVAEPPAELEDGSTYVEGDHGPELPDA